MYQLKTRIFTIQEETITQCVMRWNLVKSTFNQYADIDIISIERVLDEQCIAVNTDDVLSRERFEQLAYETYRNNSKSKILMGKDEFVERDINGDYVRKELTLALFGWILCIKGIAGNGGS